MACFIVPAAEAVVMTVAEKHAEHIEETAATEDNSSVRLEENKTSRIPMSRKLKWLTYMLWGGVLLLAFEHIWHGEVTPWLPFLTAMSDPADAAEMFHEMATAGVCMSLLVTAVWFGICRVADMIVKRPDAVPAAETLREN